MLEFKKRFFTAGVAFFFIFLYEIIGRSLKRVKQKSLARRQKMQGPTHILAGIAWQEITDYSLEKAEKILNRVFPTKKLSLKNLRWLIIPAGAFFGHGFLDLFVKVTYHPPLFIFNPHDVLIILFNITLAIWIFKEWIIKDWKNLKLILFWKRENRVLWRKFRYGLAVIFGWLIPDIEHVYHWIRIGPLQIPEIPDLGYPLHNIAMWPWRQIPELIKFIDGLPSIHGNPWAFFVELLVILLFLSIIYLFFKKLGNKPRES